MHSNRVLNQVRVVKDFRIHPATYSLSLRDLLSRLLPITFAYLSIPYFIFFVGWLRQPFSFIFLALLIIALVYSHKWSISFSTAVDPTRTININWWSVATIAVIILMIMCLSGIGGYGHQNWNDWRKHNAVLSDLISQPWPVVYQIQNQQVPLDYYIGYYLPAALIGKLTNWEWANQFLFIWSTIGLFLAIAWLSVVTERFGLRLVLFFLLFSGLDVIGFTIRGLTSYAQYFDLPNMSPLHIEHWSYFWQYSSNMTLLFWVPNQAIAGWMATGLAISTLRRSSQFGPGIQFFILGLLFLWSPFAVVGLLPCLLVDFISQKATMLTRIKRYVSIQNVVGLVFLAIISFFYLSKTYLPFLELDGIHGNVALYTEFNLPPDKLYAFVLFFVLEVGIYVGVIAYIFNKEMQVQQRGANKLIQIATVAIVLLLIPFVHLGPSIDFNTRASIPALLVLNSLVVDAFDSKPLSKPGKLLLFLIFSFGMVTALVEIIRHIYLADTFWKPPVEDGLIAVFEKDPFFPVHQYLGNIDSFFLQWLSRISIH